MPDPALLRCEDLDRSFGGLRALAGISLEIAAGAIVGLVGPNGSGKTTLVNVVTGFYRPERGRVVFEGATISGLPPHRIAARGIARTFQNLALFHGMTVLDNILLGRHVRLRPGPLATLAYWPWTRRREIAHRRVVEQIIDFLQLQGVRKVPVEFVPLGPDRAGARDAEGLHGQHEVGAEDRLVQRVPRRRVGAGEEVGRGVRADRQVTIRVRWPNCGSWARAYAS